MLAFGSTSFAQTIDTKKVNDLVVKKDFVGALSEVNNLRKQIQEFASTELLKAFPKSVGEFALQPADPMRSDMMGGLSMQLTYSKQPETPKGGTQDTTPKDPALMAMPMAGMGGDGSSLILSMSTNPSMATELMGAHSGGEPMMGMGGGTSEPIRIKGYRALLKFDQYSGAIGQMIVGGAFVEVRAMGQKDTKTVKILLESIDTDKLKAIAGE